MSRRRWIQDPETLELVEVGEYAPPSTDAKLYVAGDRHYEGIFVPGTGEDISTRTKHRQYMKDKGLTLLDDFKGEHAKAAKEREKFFRAEPDKNRRADVERAFHRVVNEGYKPQRLGTYDHQKGEIKWRE